jgi:shikimate dehydrogenase
MSNYAVLGSPIAHSKSPEIHRAAFAVQGIEHEYNRFEVAEDLPSFIESLGDGYLGFSLTMPLKEQALSFADWVSDTALRAQGVNTLIRVHDSWHGFNTDVPGLASAIEPYLTGSVAILGSGATARSAILACSDLKPILWARNEEKRTALGTAFDIETVDLDLALAADLVISTLTKGALDELVMGRAGLGVLFDVTYDPWPNEASKSFTMAISGLELLVQQALIQQRIFRFGSPETELPQEATVLAAMRDAVGLAE